MMGTFEDFMLLPMYSVRYYQIFQKQWVESLEPGTYDQVKNFYQTLVDCGVIRNLSITQCYQEVSA